MLSLTRRERAVALAVSLMTLGSTQPLAAQSRPNNNSDAMISGTSMSAISGMFAPGRDARGGFVSNAAVRGIVDALGSGRLASPLNGAMISSVLGGQIADLLAGKPGALTVLSEQFSAADAPVHETSMLLGALSGLTAQGASGGRASRGGIVRAVVAFNAMVRAGSPAFLAKAPAVMVGIHALLSALSSAGERPQG